MTEPRRLAWRTHHTPPDWPPDRGEWAVEQLLEWTADYSEPGFLTVLAIINPTYSPADLDLLYDVAEEVADAEANGPTGRWYVALDEYRAILARLAGTAASIYDRAVDEALAVVNGPSLDELAARRRRA